MNLGLESKNTNATTVTLLTIVRWLIIFSHMNDIKQKYTALLHKAQREGSCCIEQLGLCFQILSVAAAIDADCASRLSQYSLSEGKFVLLFLLHENQEGLSPHELAIRAGVTRPTITGLLQGLEKSALISRHQETPDRRSITIRLTQEGLHLISILFGHHTQWISGLFNTFSHEEMVLLRRLLHKLWVQTDAGKQTKHEVK